MLRILYVVTEDWYFLSHRLPMARAARDGGFEVHVATNVGSDAAAIAREGFILHPVPFVRGSSSPRASLATLRALRRIHKAAAPALVHHVSLQPTVFGLTAALGRSVPCVNALTGLGYTFTSNTGRAKLLRPVMAAVLRRLINREGMVNLVQNPDDREALIALGVAPARIAMIRGSGVDVDRLQPVPEPDGPPTIAFVGRLLADKGIRTLIAAHRLLRERRPDLQLLIAGTPDPLNPTSVSAAEAAAWGKEPGITWLGQVEDVASVWRRASIAVLPSRREGLPLSLLEAAACGRAMVATDVPGCREIVIAGETGLLVPAEDAPALAAAIDRLASDPALRARFAQAARARAVDDFSAAAIGQQIVALYRRLLDLDADSAHSPAQAPPAAASRDSGAEARGRFG